MKNIDFNKLQLSGKQVSLLLGILFLGGCTILVAVPSDNQLTVEQTQIEVTEAQDQGVAAVDDMQVDLELSPSSENDTLYSVINIVDGDTIDVDIDGETERIRLIGIDTPETVDPRKPVQCFGREASNRTKELLENTSVYLQADASQGERGKYDRLLRYVIFSDGTNFNEQMIRDGYAFEYTYDVPYEYQELFKEAEDDARESGRGLWADGVCDDWEGVEAEEEPVVEVESTPEPEPVVEVKPTPEPTPVCSCSGNIYNCSDFYTHAEAQNCYVYCLSQVGYDVHGFDRDDDGSACESLP